MSTRSTSPGRVGRAAIAGLCIAVLLLGRPAPAEDDLAATVRRLVGQLDARTRTERVAAEKELRDLGPKVLPLLPAPELAGTGARETLTKLRFDLERRQARISIQPSQVALNGRRPVAEWLSQIARETGNPLDASGLPEIVRQKIVALDRPKPAAFWDALDLLGAAGLEVDGRTESGALRIRERSAETPVRHVTAGAFRIDLTGVQRREGLVEGEDLLRVTLELQAEPRLRPLFLKYTAADIRAGSLKPLSPDASYEVLLADGSRPGRLQCDFRCPRDETAPLIDLTARLHVTVAAGSEALRFSDLGEFLTKKPVNVARRKGGVTVTLQKVTAESQDDGRQELRIRARAGYDAGGPAFESHRAWLLHNRVSLELAGGKTLALNGGLETTEQSDGALGAEYVFRDLPSPLPGVTFVYTAPTLILEVPVDLSLPAVALPRR